MNGNGNSYPTYAITCDSCIFVCLLQTQLLVCPFTEIYDSIDLLLNPFNEASSLYQEKDPFKTIILHFLTVVETYISVYIYILETTCGVGLSEGVILLSYYLDWTNIELIVNMNVM